MHRAAVRLITVFATVGALGLSGAAVSTANAAQERGDKGNTRVAVAPRLAKQITAAGVTPSVFGGAKAFAFEGTIAIRFPITNVVGGGNRIKHSGGVKLSAGDAAIALSRFSVNLNQGTVSAKVNGDARAKLFNIKPSGRPSLGAVRLTMNKTAAGALNSTFGVHLFSPGQNFGFATVNAR